MAKTLTMGFLDCVVVGKPKNSQESRKPDSEPEPNPGGWLPESMGELTIWHAKGYLSPDFYKSKPPRRYTQS